MNYARRLCEDGRKCHSVVEGEESPGTFFNILIPPVLIDVEGKLLFLGARHLPSPKCSVVRRAWHDRNETPNLTNSVPPFGIQESGDGGRSIHPRVLKTARQLWPWAYMHVDVVLHDAPAAAELLEQVAIQVSARLEAETEVARNLKGYLITAFHNHVRRELIRVNRFTYVGLLRGTRRKTPSPGIGLYGFR